LLHPVVFEVGIGPEILTGADDDEFRRSPHRLKGDALWRFNVVLIEAYIGSDDIGHAGIPLEEVFSFYQRRFLAPCVKLTNCQCFIGPH